MLILHFLGMAMGLGTSFGFIFLGMASAKMNPAQGQQFQLNALSLSKMGHIGLALLLISGGYLMTPYWSNLASMPLMMAKLVLFLILGALIGIISSSARKAKQGDTEKYLKKAENLGKLSMLTALTIVVLAVLSFH